MSMLAYSSPFDFSLLVSFVEETLAVRIKQARAETLPTQKRGT